MKVTAANIIRLWFAADTPIRSYQIKMNPRLWAACQRANRNFIPPSGAQAPAQYSKADRDAFVKTVLQTLAEREEMAEMAL